MYDLVYGPCFHAIRTCEWVCPPVLEFGSLTMRFDGARIRVPSDELPVTDPVRRELGFRAGQGPDTVRWDAAVFTVDAYDRFVFPHVLLQQGYDKARAIRTRHRACLKAFGICIHRIDCEWVCPKIGWKQLIEWDSPHQLRRVFDAIVLTPEAYERVALPFQIRTRGAARALARYQQYLSGTRELRAVDQGVWPTAPARPTGGTPDRSGGRGTRTKS